MRGKRKFGEYSTIREKSVILKNIGIKEDRLKASMIVDTADKNITRGINLFFPITCDNSF